MHRRWSAIRQNPSNLPHRRFQRRRGPYAHLIRIPIYLSLRFTSFFGGDPGYLYGSPPPRYRMDTFYSSVSNQDPSRPLPAE
jgi:hypothetical protein